MLERVHSDVCGPIPRKSVGGVKYFVTFTDDCTRCTITYLLKSKDKVTDKFIEFKELVEKQTSRQIKNFRTDNGGEFINKRLDDYLKSNGIWHEKIIPFTSEQNCVAERLNRTLVERVRCMLLKTILPEELWGEALMTAIYLKNRAPTKAVEKMTPYEAWSGLKPDLSHLRVFCCKALAHIPDCRRTKFDKKTEEFIFVGYCEDLKGYRLVKLLNKKLCKTGDVVLFETKFAAYQQINEKANNESHSEEEKMISDSRPVIITSHQLSSQLPLHQSEDDSDILNPEAKKGLMKCIKYQTQ